ncbi:MAG: arginine repressor [Planctomycetes bacterium]|nr:arginine repressor [Planctomycetota bacterium]
MVAVKERREQVLALLTEKAVSSQQELLTLLAEAGVESTQPVLSRDLRALGAVKRGGRYVVLSAERVTRLEALRPLLRGAEAAGPNLVVLSSEPGAASSIARALEEEEFDGLVGTVAGDDTIFVAVESERRGKAVIKLVHELL